MDPPLLGPAELGTTNLEPIYARITRISELHPEILSRVKMLDAANSHFRQIMAFGNDSDMEQFSIISPNDRQMLERICQSKNVEIPVFGGNSAGKSTLINAMVGVRCMPVGTGHVTGRICVLSYAPEAEACIQISTLEEYGRGQFHTSHPLNVAQCTNPKLKINDPQRLTNVLASHLKREQAPPHGTPEYQQWCNSIVQLRFPFPNMKAGIHLIDMPGASITDSAEFQDLIPRFLNMIKPSGILLAYNNASFSDDEIAAYSMIMRDMPKDPEHCPGIFFVSTFFDMDSYVVDNNLEEVTTLDCDNQIRYKFGLLKKQQDQGRLGPFANLQDNVEDSPNFAVANARDYSILKDNDSMYIPKKYIFNFFVHRLVNWSRDIQVRRYSIALNKISNTATSFFILFKNATEDRIHRAIADARAGIVRLALLSEQLQTAMRRVIEEIPQRIESRIQSHVIYDACLEEAKLLDLGDFEGRRHTTEASQTFRIKFTPVIHQFIITPVLSKAMIDLQVAMQHEIDELLADRALEANEMLRQTLLNALLVNDIVPNIKHNGFDNTLKKLTTQMAKSMETNVLVGVCYGLAIAGLAFGQAASLAMEKIASRFTNVDAKWKRKLAKSVLKDITHSLPVSSLSDQCSEHIAASITNIKVELTATIERAQAIFERTRHAQQEFYSLRDNLSELLSNCWADLALLNELHVPEIDRTTIFTDDAKSTIYPAKLDGNPVLVKIPKQDQLLSFFHEVHYNKAKSCSNWGNRTSLSAVQLHHIPTAEPMVQEWALVYPNTRRTLENVLEDRRDTMSTEEIAQLGLSVVRSLAVLHDAGLAAPNLNLQSIFVDYSEEGTPDAFIGNFCVRIPITDTDKIEELAKLPPAELAALPQDFVRDFDVKEDIYNLGLLLLQLIIEKGNPARNNLEAVPQYLANTPWEFINRLLLPAANRPTIDNIIAELVKVSQKNRKN